MPVHYLSCLLHHPELFLQGRASCTVRVACSTCTLYMLHFVRMQPGCLPAAIMPASGTNLMLKEFW